MSDEYDKQAETFLTSHDLRFRAVRRADKCPPYCDGKHCHGDCYRVTISRKGGGRVSFDFWNSQHDAQGGVIIVNPYDALACISSDAHMPDTFEEFCGDFGYEEDSHKAHKTWKQCEAFAKKLCRFFDDEELKALAEIR